MSDSMEILHKRVNELEDKFERRHEKTEERVVILERRTDVVMNILDTISKTLDSLRLEMIVKMSKLSDKVDNLNGFNNRLIGVITGVGVICTTLGFLIKFAADHW